jgi:hypothetical protein
MGSALTNTPAFSRRGQGVVDPRVKKYFGNPEVLLGFMRQTRKPVFHKSNLFFRDIQFAVHDYFETVQGKAVTIPEAEQMTREIVELYKVSGVLREVNNQAYRLDGPAWVTPKGGTYAMLTLNGTPLPGEALEPVIVEPPKVDDAKREESKIDDARITSFVLPIAPPTNAEPGHLDGRPFKPGEREYQFHRDPQAGTDNEPEPGEQRSNGMTMIPPPAERPKIAPPPWMKKN